jgi:hypothetical protein
MSVFIVDFMPQLHLITDVTQSENLMSVDFPTASKDLPTTPKGFPIIPKGFPITPKEFSITPKEFPMTPKVHSKTSANYCYELEQVKPSLTVRNISY